MGRRRMLTLGVLLVVVVGVVASACAISRTMVFPGNAVPVGERFPHPDAVDVSFDRDDVHVEGVLLPSLVPGKRPVLFFAHGNGESIDDWAGAFERFRRRGLHVAMFEYRSYGRTGGSATQQALVQDAVAFYDVVTARDDVDEDHVVLNGRSLGSGVMSQLLLHREAELVVLQSAFANLSSMASRFYAPGFVVVDDFDSETAWKTLAKDERDPPLLILHGDHDELFDVDKHPQKLASAARHAKLKTFNCGHNDCDHNAFVDDALAFFAEHDLLPKETP